MSKWHYRECCLCFHFIFYIYCTKKTKIGFSTLSTSLKSQGLHFKQFISECEFFLCLLIYSNVKYCSGESESILRRMKRHHVFESSHYLADVFKAKYRKLWFKTSVGIVMLVIRNKTKHSLIAIALLLGHPVLELIVHFFIWSPNHLTVKYPSPFWYKSQRCMCDHIVCNEAWGLMIDLHSVTWWNFVW